MNVMGDVVELNFGFVFVFLKVTVIIIVRSLMHVALASFLYVVWKGRVT